MTGITRKDANDLTFLTRDQAVDVVIRLMEERDACLAALIEATQFVEHNLWPEHEFVIRLKDTIAKAQD